MSLYCEQSAASSSTKLSSSATPPPIPLDLYGAIICHLAHSDLARCLRVCKAFHYYAVRQLYRSVIINFDHEWPRGRRRDDNVADPLRKYAFTRGQLSYSFLQAVTSAGDETVTTNDSQSDLPIPSALPSTQLHPSQYSPESETLYNHLSTYTRNLTVNSHLHSQCRHFEPLRLPNLVTLRVRPAELRSIQIDHAGDLYPVLSSETLIHTCSLQAKLQPHRLILGGDYAEPILTSLLGLWRGPLVSPSPPLREIVIIARYKSLIGQADAIHAAFANLPDTIDRLIIVLGSISHRRAVMWGLEGIARENDLRERSPAEYRRLVTRVCGGRTKVIELVGLETFGDVVNERSIERGQREIKVELKKRLLGNHWSEADADKRVEGLVFTVAA